jgi:hypothetical protein
MPSRVCKSELRYRVPCEVVFIPMTVLGWSFAVTKLRMRVAKTS